jgi:hypothetical protein
MNIISGQQRSRISSFAIRKSPPAQARVHQKAQQPGRMLMPALRRSKRSESFVPRRVYLWLSVSALLGFSAGSMPSYGKGPSYKQTIDFIILRLSGDSGSYKVRCDNVQECGGSVDTAWQNRVAPSSSSCSIDIVQSIHVTKAQDELCPWTGDVIGGKLWGHITYQSEYHFRLDLASIARDGISVEQATPDSSCCSALMESVYHSDLPYAVHLTFTKRTNVSFRIKATGSGLGEQKSSEQEGIDTWNSDTLLVGSKDLAERLARAFKHAATSCGAKEEVF